MSEGEAHPAADAVDDTLDDFTRAALRPQEGGYNDTNTGANWTR